MQCPYCSEITDTDEISVTPEEVACPRCSRRFRILFTDGNDHSPHEISTRLPSMITRLGELMAIAVRQDQRFCTVCGTFYTKKDKICPNLLRAAKSWFLDPASICQGDESLSPETVREEIEQFLKKNVKRAAWESVMKADPSSNQSRTSR